jgi:hypothetical protein
MSGVERHDIAEPGALLEEVLLVRRRRPVADDLVDHRRQPRHAAELRDRVRDRREVRHLLRQQHLRVLAGRRARRLVGVADHLGVDLRPVREPSTIVTQSGRNRRSASFRARRTRSRPGRRPGSSGSADRRSCRPSTASRAAASAWVPNICPGRPSFIRRNWNLASLNSISREHAREHDPVALVGAVDVPLERRPRSSPCPPRRRAAGAPAGTGTRRTGTSAPSRQRSAARTTAQGRDATSACGSGSSRVTAVDADVTQASSSAPPTMNPAGS